MKEFYRKPSIEDKHLRNAGSDFTAWWYHTKHRGYIATLIYDPQVYALAIRKIVRSTGPLAFRNEEYVVKNKTLTPDFLFENRTQWRKKVAEVLRDMRRHLRQHIEEDSSHG